MSQASTAGAARVGRGLAPFRSNGVMAAGVLIVVLMGVIAIAAPLISPKDRWR